jgi:hypothetical protein
MLLARNACKQHADERRCCGDFLQVRKIVQAKKQPLLAELATVSSVEERYV